MYGNTTFQIDKVVVPNVICGGCMTTRQRIGDTDVVPRSEISRGLSGTLSRSVPQFPPAPQETSHISSYVPPIALQPLPVIQSRRVVHDEYCTAKEYQSLREDYFQLRLNYENLTDGLRDRGMLGR